MELGRDKRKREEEIKGRRREGRGKGGKKGGRRKKGSEGGKGEGWRKERERMEGEGEKKSGGPNKALLASFSYFSFQTGRCPVSLRSGSRHWTHGAPSYLLDLCQR